MGKKCGLCFLFLGFFQYWLLNKLMYRERLRLNKISHFGTFFPSISSLFFPLVSSSSSIFFFFFYKNDLECGFGKFYKKYLI